MFTDANLTIDELLKRADLAMYQAKAAGRNTLRFFDPAMQAAATARATVESDLRQALQSDQMVLYYQPVVDVQERTTGRGSPGALAASHARHGRDRQSSFLWPSRPGLILELGLWVLRSACQQLVQWSGSAHTRDLSISVNVSARQFRHSGVHRAGARCAASNRRQSLPAQTGAHGEPAADGLCRCDYSR